MTAASDEKVSAVDLVQIVPSALAEELIVPAVTAEAVAHTTAVDVVVAGLPEEMDASAAP